MSLQVTQLSEAEPRQDLMLDQRGAARTVVGLLSQASSETPLPSQPPINPTSWASPEISLLPIKPVALFPKLPRHWVRSCVPRLQGAFLNGIGNQPCRGPWRQNQGGRRAPQQLLLSPLSTPAPSSKGLLAMKVPKRPRIRCHNTKAGPETRGLSKPFIRAKCANSSYEI